MREVTSSLVDDGKTYSLRISASLAPIEHTMTIYWRIALGSGLVFGLVLLALQGGQARRLTRRLSVLSRHVAAVREGRLNEALPPDPSRDEIAELRDMLADATKQLREARASQERLVADAAHELRTPLTIMRTSIDLALRRQREAPELRAALEETRDEVDRLTALASELLNLAVQGQGSLERATGDICEIVLEAVDAALPTVEARGLSLATDLPEHATALIHAAGVRQAVDNLLSNAISTRPRAEKSGSRCVATEPSGSSRWTTPGRAFPRSPRGGLCAVPSGAGALPGAGLGLAIVQEVARRHGGRAYVGEVPRGTRVAFEITAVRDESNDLSIE